MNLELKKTKMGMKDIIKQDRKVSRDKRTSTKLDNPLKKVSK